MNKKIQLKAFELGARWDTSFYHDYDSLYLFFDSDFYISDHIHSIWHDDMKGYFKHHPYKEGTLDFFDLDNN